MKKIIALFLLLFSFSVVFWEESKYGMRSCETIYDDIEGNRYFSHIHCTEDINVSWVQAEEVVIKRKSSRDMTQFFIENGIEIKEHLIGSWTCDDVNEISAISTFESSIYSDNGLTLSSVPSTIESLEDSMESLEEQHNDEWLYSSAYSEMKSKYSSAVDSYVREKAEERYYEKQWDLKLQVFDKQQEKMNILWKLNQVQQHVAEFYLRVERSCQRYQDLIDEWHYEGELSEEQEEELEEQQEDEDEEKIAQYKLDFEEKLWEKLNAMSNITLQNLSVKLYIFSKESPILKKYNAAGQAIIQLKIKALRELIADKL